MVYTAAGQPLYLPPHARKTQDHPYLYNLEQDLQEDGMQSLLSAIELDLGNVRDGTEYLSNPSMQSSFVDSPDHQELMADLLRTSFANDDTEDVLSSQFDDFSRAVTPYTLDNTAALGTTADFDFTLNPCDRYPDPLLSEAQIPPRRQWLGVLEKFKDRKVKAKQISAAIKSQLTSIIDPDATTQTQGGALTTIKLAWPSVAQKSYGHEKRLLTPFPICSVNGPLKDVGGLDVKTHLTIIPSDAAMMVAPYTAPFDFAQKSTFKALHINNDNIGKSKTVNFKLQISQKGMYDPLDIPLIDLNSPNIILLSKPSKKTSRLKIQSSFIYTQTTISLFTRINSQTARTKYLTLESDGQMSVQSDSWLPFTIHSCSNGRISNETMVRPLLYGETIILRDSRSRCTSVPLVVRRCEGKTIVDSPGGNVSQMQKIVLEKANESTTHVDLNELGQSSSSSQPRLFLSSKEAQQPRDVRNYKCIPLPFTTFESASARDGSDALEMEDAGQWTVVGVMSHSYTFLDSLAMELPTSALQSPVGEPISTVANSSSNDCETSRKRKLDSVVASDVDEMLRASKDKDETDSVANVTRDMPSAEVKLSSETEPLAMTLKSAQPETKPTLPESTAHGPELLRIQTPITPFPTLLSSPVYLPASNRLHLQVRDFWQLASTMAHLEIYLGAFGPLTVTALQQSAILPTDAALEVELPTQSQVEASRAPLLFVREDGLVIPANCMVDVPADSKVNHVETETLATAN